MGTYSELTVNGYDLNSTKGTVASSIMNIFRESDRKEFEQLREDGGRSRRARHSFRLFGVERSFWNICYSWKAVIQLK